MERYDFLEEYREDNRIEAKRAQGGLPHSLWETYSDFANTLGGVILLGVAETDDRSLFSVPVPDVQAMVAEFWALVSDPTVTNVNILSPKDVQILKSTACPSWLSLCRSPAFGTGPYTVYIGTDLYTGTYYRQGEGDFRCPCHEVEAMLRDKHDPAPLSGITK